MHTHQDGDDVKERGRRRPRIQKCALLCLCASYTNTMGIPEELYYAMLEVGYCARRHKIPGH